MDTSILSYLTLGAVVLSGVATILGGVSVVLHAIAARAKAPGVDRVAADVDLAHTRIDQVVSTLREIAPAPSAPSSSSTSTAAPLPAPSSSVSVAVAPARNPQAGRVTFGVMLTIALPILVVIGIAFAPACATLGPAAASGLIAAIDCEAQHFSTQDLVDATHLADGEVAHLFASGAAPSTSAVAADLQPFDSDAKKCALAGILAGSTAALASSSSGGAGSGSAVATQGLSARASVAPAASGADPVQVRAAVSAAARQVGWPPVKVAGGAVL